MSEGGFAPLPGVPHAIAQQARARLDAKAKAKLEQLEEHAETLLVAGRVLADRVVTLRREIVDVERQVAAFEHDPLARGRSLHRMRSAAPGSTIVDVRERSASPARR